MEGEGGERAGCEMCVLKTWLKFSARYSPLSSLRGKASSYLFTFARYGVSKTAIKATTLQESIKLSLSLSLSLPLLSLSLSTEDLSFDLARRREGSLGRGLSSKEHKNRTRQQSGLTVGLFCYIVGLFCYIAGLFRAAKNRTRQQSG